MTSVEKRRTPPLNIGGRHGFHQYSIGRNNRRNLSVITEMRGLDHALLASLCFERDRVHAHLSRVGRPFQKFTTGNNQTGGTGFYCGSSRHEQKM